MPFINSIRGNFSALRGSRAGKQRNLITGGNTITEAGGYRIHTFTSPGTFNTTSSGEVISVEYLVIGGGGASGSWGGGGGAGGYQTGTLSTPATSYPVTVGDGGTHPNPPPYAVTGNNGGNSVWSSVTSLGGGYGGNWSTGAGTGGSGGGASGHAGGGGGGAGGPGGNGLGNGSSYSQSPAPVGNNPAPGTPGQGNPGGQSLYSPGYPGFGGSGGPGLSSSISGSPVIRGGGGGGVGHNSTTNFDLGGAGGPGGGGKGGGGGPAHDTGPTGTGSVNPSQLAQANTGGGAGSQGSATTQPYFTGGSGVVILRYPYPG